MKDLGKIAGFNILFILAYDVLLRLTIDQISVMLISMFLVIGQVIYNIVKASIYYNAQKKPIANSYMLSAILVLIIGFGVCVANWR